jgi:hypothetical protein
MKFRTTLVLLIVFVVLLTAYLVFESLTQTSEDRKDREALLTEFEETDIEKMSLPAGDGVIVFERDEAGIWTIAAPLRAPADVYEVDNLVRNFARLRIERIVEEDPEDVESYGIGERAVLLWAKGEEKPVRIQLGMENPIGGTIFARRDDEKRLVLLASTLKFSLDKTLFDFRKKDVFAFETGDISKLRVQAGAKAWDVAKEGDRWWLTSPVRALASNTRIRSLLDTLSALKARSFAAEDKSTADLEAFGLAKPGYTVALSAADSGEDMVFSLARSGDDVYVSTDKSPLVVSVETRILEDLEKPIEDFREKKAADFNSWEADRVSITADGKTITAFKDGEGFDAEWKIEGIEGIADRSLIESFIRKVESLEAQTFVDAPGQRARHGLEPPGAVITVRVKPYSGEHREIVLHVGLEVEEEGRVAVRNPELAYHMMVDSSFLAEMPKEGGDWMPKEDPDRP